MANHDLFQEVWSAEGQKQGGGVDLFTILLRHPGDLNYTLFLQFHFDFRLSHARQLTVADDAMRQVQCFVDGNLYWSINKSSGLEKTHHLRFPSTFHQERPITQFLMLLRVLATAWNPFSTAKGDSLLNGRSSLDVSTTRNHGHYQSCKIALYPSPCPNRGHTIIFCFCLWVPCYINDSLHFVPTCHQVQQGGAH